MAKDRYAAERREQERRERDAKKKEDATFADALGTLGASLARVNRIAPRNLRVQLLIERRI